MAQIIPESTIKTRGPAVSMYEARNGMVQVPAAMNSPKPHCTSESCQCCCACAFTMGWANSVQAYCKLPIITMPTKADHNRTHRFISHSPRLHIRLPPGWRTGDHTAIGGQ